MGGPLWRTYLYLPGVHSSRTCEGRAVNWVALALSLPLAKEGCYGEVLLQRGLVNCNWHASRFQVIGAVHGWQAGRCLSYLANHHIHPCTLRAFFTISIIQGRAVGVAHYLLGGIVTTWAFFARPRTNAQVVFSDPSSCGIANFKLGAISIAPNLHPRSHGHIVHHTPSVLYGRRSWSSSTRETCPAST